MCDSGRNECGRKVAYVDIEHSLSSFIMVTVAWNGLPLMTPTGWRSSSVRKKFSSSSRISSSIMEMLKFALVAPAAKETETLSPCSHLALRRQNLEGRTGIGYTVG